MENRLPILSEKDVKKLNKNRLTKKQLDECKKAAKLFRMINELKQK